VTTPNSSPARPMRGLMVELAVAGVDGHHRTTALAQGGLRRRLHARIQGQVDVAPGNGRDPLQGADDAPLGVGLHPPHAHRPMEEGLVVSLDAGLADAPRSLVIGGVQLGQLGLVDLPHVADGVHRQRAVRVVAHQLGGDLHAGELVAARLHPGHFRLAEVKTQGHRLEGGIAPQTLAEAFQVLVGEADQTPQALKGVLQIGDLLGNDLQREGGDVLRQHPPLAVVDEAAGGRQGKDGDAVVLGEGGVVVVVEHLEIDHARHQHPHEQEHHDHRDDQTAREQALFSLRVLEFQVVHLRKRRSGDAGPGGRRTPKAR